MKRTLLATAALMALAAPAGAADLAVKYPVKAVPVPVFTWTGFYVGANVGYGGDKFGYNVNGGNNCVRQPQAAVFEGDGPGPGPGNCGNNNPSVDQLSIVGPGGPGFFGPIAATADLNSSGFFVGGQIGYNYQFANNIVIGFETDLQWSDISGNVALNALGSPLLSFGSSLDYFGTIRVRLGYAFDRFLPYITGGAAYGKTSTDLSILGISLLSDSSTNWGWTLGGGGEVAITDHWTFKAEYLYVDLGSSSLNLATVGFFIPIGIDVDTKFHTFKAGVNYKF